MSLTGRFRHRRTFGGKLVLQIEEVRARWLRRTPKARWRDAKVLDLAAPELRTLIDLGKRTMFMPRGPGAPSPTERATTDEPAAPSDPAPETQRERDRLPSVH